MKRYLIEYEIQLGLNFKKKINNNIVQVYLIELHSQLQQIINLYMNGTIELYKNF